MVAKPLPCFFHYFQPLHQLLALVHISIIVTIPTTTQWWNVFTLVHWIHKRLNCFFHGHEPQNSFEFYYLMSLFSFYIFSLILKLPILIYSIQLLNSNRDSSQKNNHNGFSYVILWSLKSLYLSLKPMWCCTSKKFRRKLNHSTFVLSLVPI